ncbi:glycosyltransferase family 4 protein [Peribacillus simplex]|uniref:glycosyltransferase family 4 protein n=1 Tax=Peribacillus simplex TaxID=1478 RepID=UPI003D283CD1
MKKILIVSTVSRQFYLFEQGNIAVLKSLGYEVHTAANFSDANERLDVLDIIRHHIDIERSPFSLKNIKAYKQLKKLMKSENFNVIHCHSPMGGVLSRLAARSVGISPVIYTAHGFHFYKGAPLINWLLFYPVEKFLSKFTDVIITINKEDYHRARKFNAKNVTYVPGVGVDTKKFNGFLIDRDKKRMELGIPKDAFVILSVGELNKNKNHVAIINAISKMNNLNVFYIVCGQGDRKAYIKELADSLKIADRIKLLGFRNDMVELYKTADIFAFPSYREGLSVSLMEAMASGLPCVVSNIRGNVDLIDDYLIDPDDVEGFANVINELIENDSGRDKVSNYNLELVKNYDIEHIKTAMEEIYIDLLESGSSRSNT